MTTKTALVTGASSGIGEVTARKPQDLGYAVYGAARRTERLQALAEDGVLPLAMDVTDDRSMSAGVEQIIADTGRIDVLVNNAGYGSYGALEDVSIDEGRRHSRSTFLVQSGWRNWCCRTCGRSTRAPS